MKAFLPIGMIVVCYVLSAFPITITVGKSGADFSTITGAVKAAMPGDVIKIIDAATYEEQVTVDSTKHALTLTSADPMSLTKPTIKYQDRIHVGPRTYAESLADSMITFDKNGALRIIKARDVIIDGIAIDAGGVYPFGYPSIYEQRYSLQSGNAGVVVFQSSDIVIRNCDISNAYFGIYTIDRNPGGIFAQANPADLDTNPVVPLSGFGLSGNHLFERNRIHNNSWGLFFEALWDLGSTVRYNLIYENHHPTDAIATTVKNLTDEGSNQPGGAFLFKDVPLCPLAIYNNTFYRNLLIFAGHWQAGYQHLVFNNIFGPPNAYWTAMTPAFQTSTMELTPALINRVNSCIYSTQAQAPQASYISIMNNMPQLQSAGGASPDAGALWAGNSALDGFPATADNRWLEMDSSKFLSLNPSSVNFLEPAWSDTNVQKFISHKGWEASGVKTTDGARADLGAIEQAHGAPSFVGTIKPAPLPLVVTSTGGSIQFTLNEREGTSMTEPTIKLLRLVKISYKSQTFGPSEKTIIIRASQMTALTPPAAPPVRVGPNTYSISIPADSLRDYAFIEMFIEATGADGKKFGTSAGFMPYRKLDYKFGVEVWDTTMTQKLTSVTVGVPVMLRLIPQATGEIFTKPIKPVEVTLRSGFELLAASTPAVPLVYPNGIPGGIDNKKVVFTKIPEGGIETITASGVWKSSSASLQFLGGTSVNVLGGQAESAIFLNPPSLHRNLLPPVLPAGSVYLCSLYVADAQGNLVTSPTTVKVTDCCPWNPLILIKPDSLLTTNTAGLACFTVQTTDRAREDDMIIFKAQIVGKEIVDTTEMIVGARVGVVRDPKIQWKGAQQSLTREATVSIFDLQGRRIFHRSFLYDNGVFRNADFLRFIHPLLPAKAYVMEAVVKDRITMKQTRNVHKIMMK